ncbi:hypothetical protein SH1V18_31640 [Vallitalea longa]|uniref:DUF3783 domain-containing protein n=1 Tax=Vallitalea longa TaxID=2936439 RepID=A0A9W5YEX0_9FIRM|nr:DUF3783 domain-containing protein [Vallitalea longa]GKX30684.1 hypothetical protein SH1V18_31640 [Vallitalea longa]
MGFEQINEEDTKKPIGRNCILIYGYTSEENKIIQKYSMQNSINECIIVNDDMLGIKISDLISDKTKKNDTKVNYKTGVKAKTILFNAVSNKAIHSFINSFKETSFKKPIYAVTTETSLKWKLGDLIKELVLEKMSMSKH